jgi:hypothetical protein
MADIQQEESKTYQNYYRHCDEHWGVVGDSAHNDRCSQCNKEIQPYESIDITAGENTNPKLHILFYGVKVPQWTNSAAVPIGKTIDQLRATGSYIFNIGDKDSVDEEILVYWHCFEQLLMGWRERGHTKDRWIVIMDHHTDSFRHLASLIPKNPMNFLFDKVRECDNFYIRPNDEPVIAKRPELLYNVIQNLLSRGFNQQPQQDTTMNPQPQTMNTIQFECTLELARQLLLDPGKEKSISVERILSELYGAREVLALRPLAMSTHNDIDLVDALINVFRNQVEPNKEEVASLVASIDTVIQSLRTGELAKSAETLHEEPTQLVGMDELCIAVRNAIDLLSDPNSSRKIARAWTIEYLTHAEAYLRSRRDKPVENTAADGGPAEGAVVRYLEKALGKLSNDFIAGQRALEKKFDDLSRTVYPHLEKTLLRGPAWNSQPYGPLPQMNSFPKMPDGFRFPTPSSEPVYSYPPIHQSSLKEQWLGSMFPENFDGVFLVHVEDNSVAATFEFHRRNLQAAFPSAKIHVVNYDKGDITGVIPKILNEATAVAMSTYGHLRIQNVLIKPSTPTERMSKFNVMRKVLSDNPNPTTEFTLSMLLDPVTVRERLNAAISSQAQQITQTSVDQGGVEYNHLSSQSQEFEGVFVVHVMDAETDDMVTASAGLFQQAFPQANFYIARHFQLPLLLGEAIKMVTNAAEVQFSTNDIYHLVPLKKPNMATANLPISAELTSQNLPYREIAMNVPATPELLRAYLMAGLLTRHGKRFY